MSVFVNERREKHYVEFDEFMQAMDKIAGITDCFVKKDDCKEYHNNCKETIRLILEPIRAEMAFYNKMVKASVSLLAAIFTALVAQFIIQGWN